MEYDGLSGPMAFNADNGHRTFFRLEIIELAKEGFKKIGTWDPEHGINYTRTVSQMYSDIVQSITTKEFIVTSRIVSIVLSSLPKIKCDRSAGVVSGSNSVLSLYFLNHDSMSSIPSPFSAYIIISKKNTKM